MPSASGTVISLTGTQRRNARLLAAIPLLVFTILCLHGMSVKSATFDEPIYIASGYSYFATHDFRLHRESPPLIPTLSYIPLRIREIFSGPLSFAVDSPHWKEGRDYPFAQDFFHRDNSDGFRILTTARLSILALGLLLGVLIFRFGELLFDSWAGLLALAVFSLDPNMIAHSRIVSADMGLAVFFLASHYYLYRALSVERIRPVLGLSICVALAICVKFSGLLVLPSLGILALVLYLFPPAGITASLQRSDADYRKLVLRKLLYAAGLGALLTAALMVILYHGLDGVRRYVEGMGWIYYNHRPGFYFYLLGQFRQEAWPHYYLISMALKTPVPTMVLLALSFLTWRRGTGHWHKAMFLVVPFLVIHLVSAMDQANVGLRRVLAAYPFLFLAIGRLGLPSPGREKPYGNRLGVLRAAIVSVLVGSLVLSAWLIHPHQLSFFNALAGGPAEGYKYLSDSDIDWGQDLPALARYMRENQLDEIALAYFGTDLPESYGIRWRPVASDDWRAPRRAVYAVSVQRLIYLQLAAREWREPEIDWLARFTPSGRAGYSIHIYDLR